MMDRAYRLYCYWRSHGMSALRQLVYRTLASKLHKSWSLMNGEQQKKSVTQINQTRFEQLAPLRTYTIPSLQNRRVNVVTDSVAKGSLFGGVGTALIFAALLANKLDAQLRIVTRTQRAEPQNISSLLSLYGISLKRDMQFKFAAFFDEKYELDVADEDIFITTSWWTTAATLPSVRHDSIIYLLQEDERMFYPYGDDRVKCEAILRTPDIRFLINTKLLFDHMVNDGLSNIAEKGMWFEPAFPSNVFYPRTKTAAEKNKFFFYARPNNVRNLFYLGIEIIDEAINQRVLDLDTWEIFLVGKDIPHVVFGGDYVPHRCENFAWGDYAEFAGTVDLGLSLMSTPHPSYPPLDLAASGAVVVTNRFGGKTDLSAYSPNLFCADLDRDALVDALRVAVRVATDPRQRETNFKSNGLLVDWEQAFSGSIDKYAGEI